MKFVIDTKNKIIELRDDINIGEFIKFLEDSFNDESWKEYTISATTKYEWISPIVIEPYPYRYPYPWNTPYYTSDTTGAINKEYGETTVYCCEIK